MKKKTIIAFFCATLSVCAIYGGLRYAVSSGTGQVTMTDILEGENSMDGPVPVFRNIKVMLNYHVL